MHIPFYRYFKKRQLTKAFMKEVLLLDQKAKQYGYFVTKNFELSTLGEPDDRSRVFQRMQQELNSIKQIHYTELDSITKEAQ